MRDPNRFDNFYKEVCEIHKEKFPDWRYGQLMSNFLDWIITSKKRDPFFFEENEILRLFTEYAGVTDK